MSNNISKKSVTIALFCYAMYNDIDISIVVIVTCCLSVRQTGGRAGGRAGMRAGGQAGRQRQRKTERQGDRDTSMLPAQHGFSVHHEHHLFLHLTVEELKHP